MCSFVCSSSSDGAIDCRLSIISCGNKWESNISCRGRIKILGDSAVVHYAIDGDECTLILSQDRIEQVRKGSVNIRISFVEGGKTACILGDENLRGGYEVFTSRLSCTVKKFGAVARIEYLSGEDKERITLSVRATFIPPETTADSVCN